MRGAAHDLLIERGADVNRMERGGFTALAWAQTKGRGQIVAALLAAGALGDPSETPEEQQRERERLDQYAHDLELTRREFSVRAENQETTKAWAGAWADPRGPGAAARVYHADGTVMSCSGNEARESAHLDDPGDGTLFYRLLGGQTTKVVSRSVGEDGRWLTLDCGDFVSTFERL